MTPHHLYKVLWYWKDDKITFQSINDANLTKQQTRQVINQDPAGEKNILFLENVDQANQKFYKQKYQRPIKQNVPSVVTMQDVKDVVTYLMIGIIPQNFLSLFHSYEMNNFLRALIVYLQLYLQVWEDLLYRRKSYLQQRLKHPISVIRETRCKNQLSKLRSRIGQEYALLITGEGKYKKYHHMNNTINRSYTTKDLSLNEYLFKFSARVVWIALYRSNYKEIEVELARLFNSRKIHERVSIIEVAEGDRSERNVLHGDTVHFSSHWRKQSPAISDIFINQDKPDLLISENVYSPKFEANKITGLEAALTLPEELLKRYGITVGILGESRDSFEVMLHVKQGPSKSLEEEELDKAFGKLESETEKPTFKMYEYLKELETVIDLNDFGSREEIIDVKEVISMYISNHIGDSKKAFKMWKYIKSNWM